MKRLIVAAVAVGALCALSANAQQVAVQAASPEVSSSQNWVFGTVCDFNADNDFIDFIVGFGAAGDMAWIQGYEVDENNECDCIGGVMIQMFRTAANPTDMWEGREVTVYLWSDPTNDLDPGDAVLEGEAQFIVPVGRGQMFIEFPPKFVTDRFWVAGSIFANGAAADIPPELREFPAAFNSLIDVGDEAWLAYNAVEIDPDDLGSQIQGWGNPFRARPMLMDDSECEGGECDVCDMDCDGDVDAFDIEPFLALLFDENLPPCCGTRGTPPFTGDTDGDGDIDAFDIEPFLSCLFP